MNRTHLPSVLRLTVIAVLLFQFGCGGPANQAVPSAANPGVGALTQAPAIDAVTPNFGPAAGGSTVTITGADFQEGLTVLLEFTPQQIQVVTPTSITFVTGPGQIGGCFRSCTGVVDVTVTNPDGKSAKVLKGFVYVP